MLRISVVAVALAASACASAWPADPQIYGFDLQVAPQCKQDWPVREDLRPRLRRAVEMAAAFWGIEPSAVSGWRLLLNEGLVQCGSDAAATGCTTTKDQTVAIAADFYRCVESSTLMHEIGHIALDGDPEHRDPRWHDDAAMLALWTRMHEGLPEIPDCGGEAYRRQWQAF
ncbi:MAG TPA: hypothetical protein VGQ83_30660 [Polyangia bacterium]|jgi:hypothetical protein